MCRAHLTAADPARARRWRAGAVGAAASCTAGSAAAAAAAPALLAAGPMYVSYR